MDLGIAGKRALVCGASQGMGYAIARALAAQGAELFICSRTKENLSKLADELGAEIGRRVYFEACDLSEAASRDQLVEAVGKVFDGVDILVHNSGGPKSTRAEDTKVEDWVKGFELLFPAIAHLNEAFVPGMKDCRWGRNNPVTSLSVMEPIPNLAISNAMSAAVTLRGAYGSLRAVGAGQAPGKPGGICRRGRLPGFATGFLYNRFDHLRGRRQAPVGLLEASGRTPFSTLLPGSPRCSSMSLPTGAPCLRTSSITSRPG
jgi:hypothetical protein